MRDVSEIVLCLTHTCTSTVFLKYLWKVGSQPQQDSDALKSEIDPDDGPRPKY